MAFKRRKASAKAAEKFAKSRGGKRTILKLDEGTTKVRILPLLNKDDEVWPIYTVYRYPYKLFSSGGYRYSPVSVGKPDVVAELISEIRMKNAAVADALQEQFRASNRFLLPVVLRDEVDNLTGKIEDIKLLDVAWNQIDSITEAIMDPDWVYEVDGDEYDVLDHEFGCDMSVSKVKSGRFFEMGYNFTPKRAKIRENDAVLEKLLSHKLEDVVNMELEGSIPTDDELKKLLQASAAALLDYPAGESQITEDDILSGDTSPDPVTNPVSADADNGSIDLDEDDLPF